MLSSEHIRRKPPWLSKYFGRLFVYDPDFTTISGDLARTWSVSDDGKTWTLTLRDDVRWHDGQPFTAKDVRFSLELMLTPDFGAIYAGQFHIIDGADAFVAGRSDHVSGIEIVDDYTIRIKTTQPLASFIDILAWTLFIVPEHALADIDPAALLTSSWWRTNPIGTGPFKWNRYVADQYVELVRNEHYYGGVPKIERLINRYFADPGAATLALESGEIDFTYINEDEADRLRQNPNLTVIEGPSHVANYIAFNHRDPLFQDARVRQAFSYAIDREAIVETIYQGAAQIVNSIYHNPIYLPDDLVHYDYDPDKARELLREAGWDSSQQLDLVTYYDSPLAQDVMAVIQFYLAEVGVHVVPRVMDVPTYNSIFYPGDFQLTYRGLGNGPDPDAVRPLFHSELTHPDGLNGPGYNFPALDEGLDKGRVAFDPVEQQRWYQQVARTQNHEATDVFLWVATRYGAVSNRIANFVWTPAPAASRYYDDAERWEIVD